MADARQTIVKIDGRLRLEDLGELMKTVRSASEATVLELSDLQSADRDGARVLRELVARGAEVRGASPYMELMLNDR